MAFRADVAKVIFPSALPKSAMATEFESFDTHDYKHLPRTRQIRHIVPFTGNT
jgi:hypothetical protein